MRDSGLYVLACDRFLCRDGHLYPCQPHAVSKKAILFLDFVSMLKQMEGCWLLMWCRKSPTFDRLLFTNVLST